MRSNATITKLSPLASATHLYFAPDRKAEYKNSRGGNMSYQFYKVLHFIGIFLILISLGGIAFQMVSGSGRDFVGRKFASALHGTGLLIAVVAGFGLMAKIGIMASWPSWVFGKIAVWFFLALMPLALYRTKKQSQEQSAVQSKAAKVLLFLMLALASAAAYLATNKPGSPASAVATPAEFQAQPSAPSTGAAPATASTPSP
jgi:uncharacterized membrane protein SirB2